MDDSLTRSRPKSPDEIIRSLQARTGAMERPIELPAAAPAATPAPQDEPQAFDPDATEYQAFGRAGNQRVPSLRFILKDRSERGFAYAHLDSLYPGGCEFIPSAPGKGNVIK